MVSDLTEDSQWSGLDWSEIDLIVSTGEYGSPSNVHHLVVGFEDRPGTQRTHASAIQIEKLGGNLACFQSPAEQLIRVINESGEIPGGLELDMPDVVTSPIVSSSDCAVAALYTMDKEIGRILSVPELADLGQWFRAFVDYLRVVDPSMVPLPLAPSSSSEIWYSPLEKSVRDQIAATADERERLEKRVQDLTLELDVAMAEADEKERKVLWEVGTSLEKSVGSMFEDLGFRIKYSEKPSDMDESEVEDLYITPSDGSGRVAIIKVRGYSEGVEVADLQKLNKNTSRFAAEHGREAELSLLVANPFRNVDLSLRSTAQDGLLHDQASLTNATVVKATDLYCLWRDHIVGLLDATKAQEILFAADIGIWEYHGPVQVAG